jgi:DNA-binding PadR family transcriptional regulator
VFVVADNDFFSLVFAHNLTSARVYTQQPELYRFLARLLDEGLIEETEGDERRRFYRISRAGRRALRAEASRLEGLVGLARARKVLTGSDS